MLKAAGIALGIAYPVLVYAGLSLFEPRTLAGVLGAAVIVRVQRRRVRESRLPLPIAFGGSGLCSNIELVDDSTMKYEGKVEHLNRENSKAKENYFSEYDDYSFRRPTSDGSGSTYSERKVVRR